MEPNKEHFRHILLFYFNSHKSAHKCWVDICDVYGADAVTERTCFNWFRKFREGNFSLEDEPKAGRSREVDGNKIMELVDANPHYTTRELGDMLSVSNTTISNYLNRLGYMNKEGIWCRMSEKNIIKI